MKKTAINLFALAIIVVLCYSVQINAKAKQIKLNKTNVIVENGKSIQLRLKNAKKEVKWSSSNKYTASVNKKGKVTGKRLGKVTITARSAGKKYRCRVRICSNINADRIMMTYANDVFTQNLLKKVVSIEQDGYLVVNDKKAIRAIYSKFSSLKLSQYKLTEPLNGGIRIKFKLDGGKTVEFVLSGLFLEVNGIDYRLDKNVVEDIVELIKENQYWG